MVGANVRTATAPSIASAHRTFRDGSTVTTASHGNTSRNVGTGRVLGTSPKDTETAGVMACIKVVARIFDVGLQHGRHILFRVMSVGDFLRHLIRKLDAVDDVLNDAHILVKHGGTKTGVLNLSARGFILGLEYAVDACNANSEEAVMCDCDRAAIPDQTDAARFIGGLAFLLYAKCELLSRRVGLTPPSASSIDVDDATMIVVRRLACLALAETHVASFVQNVINVMTAADVCSFMKDDVVMRYVVCSRPCGTPPVCEIVIA